MNETNGTEYNIGWGQGIVRPSLEDVRKMEEKYLPADLQPDYVNTLNA
jgi:hypothetical protein